MRDLTTTPESVAGVMFCDCTRRAAKGILRRAVMNESGEIGGLEILRAWTLELVEACVDADLLDFVYKLLLMG